MAEKSEPDAEFLRIVLSPFYKRVNEGESFTPEDISFFTRGNLEEVTRALEVLVNEGYLTKISQTLPLYSLHPNYGGFQGKRTQEQGLAGRLSQVVSSFFAGISSRTIAYQQKA